MRKVFTLAAIAAALHSVTASAADLAQRKGIADETPLRGSIWEGAYAGVNIGYNAGTNSNVTSGNLNNQPQGVPTPSTISSAVNGNASNNQAGFVGGVQLGYNYLTGSLLVGAEVDLEGSNTRGTSLINGNVLDQSTGTAFGGLLSSTYTGTGVGTNSIQGGVDYIGTVRARVGYLIKPELLIYGTAGLAYGGAWANVAQFAAYDASTVSLLSSSGGVPVTYSGGGRQDKLLVGWTAGVGAEWMFMPNWSLKGEALYWDLGRMTVNTKAPGTDGTRIWGQSSVNYAGIMARAGLNYHLNLSPPSSVTKY